MQINVYVVVWKTSRKPNARIITKSFLNSDDAERWCARHEVPHVAIYQFQVIDPSEYYRVFC